MIEPMIEAVADDHRENADKKNGKMCSANLRERKETIDPAGFEIRNKLVTMVVDMTSQMLRLTAADGSAAEWTIPFSNASVMPAIFVFGYDTCEIQIFDAPGESAH